MVDYVEQLLQFRRSRVTPEQIGVITPFAKQVATPRTQPATLCCQPATLCCQPATPCTQACNPVHSGLQPRAPWPATHAPSAWPHAIAPFAAQAHKIATLLRARGHMQAGGGVKVGGVESFQGQARAHACPRLQPYQCPPAALPVDAHLPPYPCEPPISAVYQERKAIIISTVRSSVGQLKHNLT